MEEEKETNETVHLAEMAEPTPSPQQEVTKEEESEKGAASSSKSEAEIKFQDKEEEGTELEYEDWKTGLWFCGGLKGFAVRAVTIVGIWVLGNFLQDLRLSSRFQELGLEVMNWVLTITEQPLDTITAEMAIRILVIFFISSIVAYLAVDIRYRYDVKAQKEAELFSLVEKIVERLREQHEASLKSDGSISNCLAVNDLRDHFLIPEERASKLDLWTKVVDHIKLNEKSRVGEEIKQVDGVEIQVWKWLPDTTHPKDE